MDALTGNSLAPGLAAAGRRRVKFELAPELDGVVQTVTATARHNVETVGAHAGDPSLAPEIVDHHTSRYVHSTSE